MPSDSITDTLRLLFERQIGTRVDRIEQLRGDGSARSIYRIVSGTATRIGIHGIDRAENRAFISFSKTFASFGLRVPHIDCVSDDESLYIEEDFGDVTLLDWIAARSANGFSDECTAMYERVVRALPRFQVEAGRAIDYSLCYQYAEFGRESMLFDLHYFRDMFLARVPLTVDRLNLQRDFEALVAFLHEELRDHFLYRDFQSRNIMIVGSEPHFIDYQSGRRGALQYDLASLLNDARARIPLHVRAHLIDLYLRELAAFTDVESERFIHYYDGFALIRVLQALGAYGNLGLRQQKEFFIDSIPDGISTLALILQSATAQRFPYLHALLSRITTIDALRDSYALKAL